ncbi:transposable element Tcb1 transposase [Trichonephila clavipes]|nr:transposable element Tcb1 transposase [Trichonephila clavipes]
MRGHTQVSNPQPSVYKASDKPTTPPRRHQVQKHRIGLIDLSICHIPKKIGSRVGRNKTTIMRICDRWIQENTKDRRGQSHPPQCTTSREDRQIVRMAVTDRSVTSRTVAQHIESVTHHSVSARTIPRSSQQSGLSARRPLLGLPLTQNQTSPPPMVR